MNDTETYYQSRPHRIRRHERPSRRSVGGVSDDRGTAFRLALSMVVYTHVFSFSLLMFVQAVGVWWIGYEPLPFFTLWFIATIVGTSCGAWRYDSALSWLTEMRLSNSVEVDETIEVDPPREARAEQPRVIPVNGLTMTRGHEVNGLQLNNAELRRLHDHAMSGDNPTRAEYVRMISPLNTNNYSDWCAAMVAAGRWAERGGPGTGSHTGYEWTEAGREWAKSL